MLVSDMILAWDPGFRSHLEVGPLPLTLTLTPNHNPNPHPDPHPHPHPNPYPLPNPNPNPTPDQVYAEDEELLAKDFAVAFKKLTELGCGFPSMQLA